MDGSDFTYFKSDRIVHLDDATTKTESVQMDSVKVLYGHLPYGFDKMFISDDLDDDTNGLGEDRYVLSIEELEQMERGEDEHGKFKDLWINKLNFTYYTVLRDPTDFVVANYYEESNMEKYRDLDEFIDHKLNRNVMTKYVAGADVKAWYNVQRRQSKTGDIEDLDINQNEYMTARANLINMGWIGLFENLEHSVDHLKYFWNLEVGSKINEKPVINQNFDKPLDVPLTQIQRELILKRNRWDKMLYELAVVLQQQQEIVIKYKA